MAKKSTVDTKESALGSLTLFQEFASQITQKFGVPSQKILADEYGCVEVIQFFIGTGAKSTNVEDAGSKHTEDRNWQHFNFNERR